MTSSALGVTTEYASDGQMPLTISSGGKTTEVLYGLGPVAEKTDEWNYVLSDGVNVPRQLTDNSGLTTLAVRYNPWGKPIETSGTGNFDASFIGTLIDATTGLIYVGNGQYYDPETGRFLTRGVNPNSTNPYVPWNPITTFAGPLGIVVLLNKRKKDKNGKTQPLVIFAIIGLAVFTIGQACSACAPAPESVTNPSNTSNTQTQAPAATTVPSNTPAPTETPTQTVTPPPPCCNWSGSS